MRGGVSAPGQGLQPPSPPHTGVSPPPPPSPCSVCRRPARRLCAWRSHSPSPGRSVGGRQMGPQTTLCPPPSLLAPAPRPPPDLPLFSPPAAGPPLGPAQPNPACSPWPAGSARSPADGEFGGGGSGAPRSPGVRRRPPAPPSSAAPPPTPCESRTHHQAAALQPNQQRVLRGGNAHQWGGGGGGNGGGGRGEREEGRAGGAGKRDRKGAGGGVPSPGCRARSAPWPPAAPGASPAPRSAGRWEAVGTPAPKGGGAAPGGSDATLHALAAWENWSCSGLQNSSKVSASALGAGALGGLLAGAAFLHLATSSCCCRRLRGRCGAAELGGRGARSAVSSQPPSHFKAASFACIERPPPSPLPGF